MESSQSEQIDQLAMALCEAQKIIKPAKKNQTNPFFNKKYADLESIWDACRKPLTENGLSVVQTMNPARDGIELVTTLMHKSGQWKSSVVWLPVEAQNPQKSGIAITYARRYQLSAITGCVADEDDDAEGAMDRDKPGKQTTKKTTTKPPAGTVTGTNVICPKCGKSMVERTKGKSKFYGCSDYPNCKGTVPIPKDKEEKPADPETSELPESEFAEVDTVTKVLCRIADHNHLDEFKVWWESIEEYIDNTYDGDDRTQIIDAKDSRKEILSIPF